MTLAFALIAPYGLARDLARTLPGGLEEGVVLGADSRFSNLTGSQARNDKGAKLWIFGGGTAAVFAGNVGHAERALGAYWDLRRKPSTKVGSRNARASAAGRTAGSRDE